MPTSLLLWMNYLYSYLRPTPAHMHLILFSLTSSNILHQHFFSFLILLINSIRSCISFLLNRKQQQQPQHTDRTSLSPSPILCSLFNRTLRKSCLFSRLQLPSLSLEFTSFRFLLPSLHQKCTAQGHQ